MGSRRNDRILKRKVRRFQKLMDELTKIPVSQLLPELPQQIAFVKVSMLEQGEIYKMPFSLAEKECNNGKR